MAEQLKNLYSKEFIEKLANKLFLIYSNFEKEDFINSIFDSTWQDLELKQRMRHIAFTLNKYLPFSYDKQLEILKKVKDDFTGLEAMVFQDFVEVFGLNNFSESMKALEVFTINSSSEFAIRQFILKYENETINQMKLWSQSSNEHLRRLASEGCRPRLPWAVSLPLFKQNPTKPLEIIELLKNDKSLYVRKSVANNLNDISKDNLHLVIKFIKQNLGVSKELDWICKHGSRTLLKKGDKEVLKLFDYEEQNHINIINFICDEEVKIGEDLNFSFELVSKNSLGNLRVEYMIDYLKQKENYSKKIFMISQNNFKENSKKFIKKQSFRNMTTRKHIVGEHKLSVVINGIIIIEKAFNINDIDYQY